MKKLFIVLMLAFSGISMANTIDLKESVEVEIKEDECCMKIRACWKEGTTTVCGPWVEVSVPCDKGVALEADNCPPAL